MRPITIVLLAGWMGLMGQAANAQGGLTQSERRGLTGSSNPQELVSIAPTTTLDRALSVISEVTKKSIGKIIVDTEHRAGPINVDIKAFHWRDALAAICRANGLQFMDFENYIQVYGNEAQQGAPQASGAAPVTEILKEAATFRSREIKISAIFFEVNLSRLEEVGINWTFMKSASTYTLGSEFNGGDQLQNEIFKVDLTPKVKFANINMVAKLFSNYNLGEILSGPQLIVRSGEEGRIQVGQDFSIRERDFAGNLIDKFYSAGTIVKVTPQVIVEQGVSFVHMNVEAERSSVTPGEVSTIVNRTKANTNVLLLDGEETIIGGLYNNEATTIRTGVPFLKDLPWYVFGLRYLFGYDKEEVDKKELVILLKAELVPTLQERIAQKVRPGTVMDRWRQEQQDREKNFRSGNDK
jgi:general secretion pathway protein D